MRARVEYTCDYSSRNGDDQSGRVIITPSDNSGRIHGTWSCEGGMGQGTNLDENTTTCWDDEEADLILDSNDICQGTGVFDCDIDWDDNGWPIITNIQWIE